MKIFIATLLFIGFAINGYSQDLIVTNAGDSIHCKITKINLEDIQFVVKVNNKLNKESILKSEVTSYIPNYFENEMPDDQMIDLSAKFPRHRFAIGGGLGYLTARIDKNDPQILQDYYRKIKSGTQFNVDYSYFINESIGIGVKYSTFNTSEVLGTFTIMNPDSTFSTGQVSDDISITYIGPSLVSRRLSIDNRNALISRFGLGYVKYNNDTEVIDKFNIKGQTFGIMGSLGWDSELAKNFSLGIEVGFYAGVLTKITVSDDFNSQEIKLDPDQYESIGRIEVSVGFSVNL